MNKPALLIAILLLFGFTDCVPKGKITKPRGKKIVANNLAELKKQIGDNTSTYKWLSTQAAMTYDDGNSEVTANLSMRNRSDSIIWASANLLIEAARILVNKDSATILNRLQKNYSVFPVADLNKMFAINNLDLHSVQNLLRALPPFAIDDKSKFETLKDGYRLQNQQATYKEDITIDPAILRMTQYRYERNASEYVLINYSDFKEAGNQVLPNKIDIEVHTPEKIHITLNISDYSLEETNEAPFYIPDSYTKVK